MREKRKNEAECIGGLNKIQRSDERVSLDKECLERHNDSLQNKRSASSLHCSWEFWTEHQKNMLVDKISRKKKNYKKKGPQIRCIPHRR